MLSLDSKHFIIIGGVLLVISWILALLMVIAMLPSTLFLNLIVFSAMLVGMVLGMWGIFNLVRARRDVDVSARREIPEEYRADAIVTKRK
jgi:predicted ABC-type sugar transport system permease subunit